MTSTAISVIGMDIYAVGGTIVSQCELQCCQMAITIYRRLMKLFLPIWQHHHLMIVSIIVSILHGQMLLIPPLGHGTTNPKLDASLLQCILRNFAHVGELQWSFRIPPGMAHVLRSPAASLSTRWPCIRVQQIAERLIGKTRTPQGLERSRRANWKHGHFSREAKAERSRLRAAILALRDLCGSI
jgi:hypothetical protein